MPTALTPKAAQRVEAERRAWEMRQGGASYEEIGRALGMGRSGVWKMLQRSLKAMRGEMRNIAEDTVATELARLDRMQRAIWADAVGYLDSSGQPVAPDLKALDRVLAIMARRAALLGLDKTTALNANINVPVEGDDARRRLADRIAKALGG